MNPDFHNRLRCSLPELKLLANLQQEAISLLLFLVMFQNQPMCLKKTVKECVKVMKGEALVHPPLLLPAILLAALAPPRCRPPQLLGSQQGLCIFPGALRQTSKPRRLLFSRPFRCRWVEDDIVYGLYQLQLDYAFHLVGNIIYVQPNLIKLILFAC